MANNMASLMMDGNDAYTNYLNSVGVHKFKQQSLNPNTAAAVLGSETAKKMSDAQRPFFSVDRDTGRVYRENLPSPMSSIGVGFVNFFANPNDLVIKDNLFQSIFKNNEDAAYRMVGMNLDTPQDMVNAAREAYGRTYMGTIAPRQGLLGNGWGSHIIGIFNPKLAREQRQQQQMTPQQRQQAAIDGFIRSGGNGFLTDRPQKENRKG